MNNDKPLLAAIIGGLSTISAEIISRIMLALGIGQYSIYLLDSLVLTLNRPNFFLGLYINFVIGGLVGLIFYYLIKCIGQANLIIKGAFVGMLATTIAEVIFSSVIEGTYIPLRPIGDYYLHIVGSAGFGLTMGIAFKAYIFFKDTAGSSSN